MSYGQTHSEEIPTVGETTGEEFANMVNAVLTEMRTTLDAKVTPAGIDLNADLDFRSGANYAAVLNLHHANFVAQADGLDGATYAGSLYKGANGELYFNDDSGNEVQLTDGGFVAAAAGNIAGTGYDVTTGKVITWNNTDGDYVMGSGTDPASDYADVKLGDVMMSDGSSHWLRMSAGASMSADYTLTWPAALPAAKRMVLCDTSGNLSYSQSALEDIALASGKHITLAGVGRLKHGTRTLPIPGIAFRSTSTANHGSSFEGVSALDAVNNSYKAPLLLEVGKRVTGVTFTATQAAGSGTSRSYQFVSVALATGVATTHYTVSSSTELSSRQTFASGALTVTITAGSVYYLVASTSETGDDIHGCVVTYDEP